MNRIKYDGLLHVYNDVYDHYFLVCDEFIYCHRFYNHKI